MIKKSRFIQKQKRLHGRILKLRKEGWIYKEIAEKVGLGSAASVKYHVDKVDKSH